MDRPTSTPLLFVKLDVPPVRPDLVPRLQLTRRLDDGLRPGHKLILLGAPAWFGRVGEVLVAWAPTIGAVTVTVIAGRAGVRRLLRGFLIWRVNGKWYLVDLPWDRQFAILAVVYILAAATIAIRGGMPHAARGTMPALGSWRQNTPRASKSARLDSFRILNDDTGRLASTGSTTVERRDVQGVSR